MGRGFSNTYNTQLGYATPCSQINLPHLNNVFHLANPVHNKVKNESEFIEQYVGGTKAICDLTIDKCNTFVYISTAGVYGSTSDTLLNEQCHVKPLNLYTLAKVYTEMYLRHRFRDSRSRLLIIRIPMVYGRNCPGNLRTIKRLAILFRTLPFYKLTHNLRSVLGVSNFSRCTSFLANATQKPFSLVNLADPLPYSTFDIIDNYLKHENISYFPISVSSTTLKMYFDFFGLHSLNNSLIGNMTLDLTNLFNTFPGIEQLLTSDWKESFYTPA